MFELRDAIRHLDDETDYKYDLTGMYEATELSEPEKKLIAAMIADAKDPEDIAGELFKIFNTQNAMAFDDELTEDTVKQDDKCVNKSEENHLDEALHGMNEVEQFVKMADAIGLKTMSDVKDFLEREGEGKDILTALYDYLHNEIGDLNFHAKDESLNEADVIIPKDKMFNPDSISLTGIAKQAKEAEDKKKSEARLKPMLDEVNKASNKLSVLFNKLVPDSGAAQSVAGEMVRAMMRILYRDRNDGDVFYEGYGLETCGSSAEFLMDSEADLADDFKAIVEDQLTDEDYTEAITDISNKLVEFIVDNPHLMIEDNTINSRDYSTNWLEEHQPKYDYTSTLPEGIVDHISNGDISTNDLQYELSYWEIPGLRSIEKNCDSLNVYADTVEINGLTKDAYDWINENLYSELESYANTLDEEYGSVDHEELDNAQHESLKEDQNTDSLETYLSDGMTDYAYGARDKDISYNLNSNIIEIQYIAQEEMDESLLNYLAQLANDWLSSNGYLGKKTHIEAKVRGNNPLMEIDFIVSKDKITPLDTQNIYVVLDMEGSYSDEKTFTTLSKAEKFARNIINRRNDEYFDFYIYELPKNTWRYFSNNEIDMYHNGREYLISTISTSDVIKVTYPYLDEVATILNELKQYPNMENLLSLDSFYPQRLKYKPNKDNPEEIIITGSPNEFKLFPDMLQRIKLKDKSWINELRSILDEAIDICAKLGYKFTYIENDDKIPYHTTLTIPIEKLRKGRMEESLKEGYKDFIFTVKCNDGPKELIKVVASDKAKAEKYAKKMYAQNHTTYADDRYNEWYIEDSDHLDETLNSIKESEEDGLENATQEYTSANTSINSAKLPAIFSMVNFKPETINLDYGGGKFDNATTALEGKGVTNLVYDPYNRSSGHNKDVIDTVRKNGGADTVTCSNVLNVIKEPEARKAVIKNIYSLLKNSGTAYFTVYEGTGKGNEGPTKSGYQLNKKTGDYVEEISSVFPSVSRRGKLIMASKGTSVTEEFDDDWSDTLEESALNEATNSNEWEEVTSKSVEDSDGFLTDYVWYTDGNKHVFVFGDSDIYRPEDGDFDWEIDVVEGKEAEAYKEAQDWFDSYNGFAEEDLNEAQDVFDIQGQAVRDSKRKEVLDEFKDIFGTGDNGEVNIDTEETLEYVRGFLEDQGYTVTVSESTNAEHPIHIEWFK